MEPPRGSRAPRTANGSSRILGLLAAVGFSIAMWVFIAVAVLGLLLKVVGPKGAEEGLAAAGITLPEGFGFDTTPTDKEPDTGLSSDPLPAGAITTLDGRPLGAEDGKTPDAAKPPEAPAKSAPAQPRAGH